MGYRNYIGFIPKQEYDKIKEMSLTELLEYKQQEYISGHDLVEDLHEFGKYVDEFNESLLHPVFINSETQQYFSNEDEFYLVHKEFLEEFINYYSTKIRKYYSELLEPFFGSKGNPISEFLNSSVIKYDNEYNDYQIGDITKITEEENKSIFKLINHIKSMASEWGVSTYFNNHLPFNLQNESPTITTSLKYEYVIFELVRIYKTFDWENSVMIYYGY